MMMIIPFTSTLILLGTVLAIIFLAFELLSMEEQPSRAISFSLYCLMITFISEVIFFSFLLCRSGGF